MIGGLTLASWGTLGRFWDTGDHNKGFSEVQAWDFVPHVSFGMLSASTLDSWGTMEQEVVRCMGGDRYVERCWGFPDLKIKTKSKIRHFSISCLLIDIDSISKFFKILLDGSSGLTGAHLSFSNVLDFQICEICKNIMLSNLVGIS